MRPAVRALLCLLPLLATGIAHAESASDIFQSALARHEKRLAGIRDYTVVQSAMGFEVTTEYVVSDVDGHRVVRVKGAEDGGLDDAGMLYGKLEEMSKNAKLQGRETVAGVDCWKIEVTELSDLDLMPSVGKDAPEMEPETGTFWLGREDLLLRRVLVDGTMTNEGKTGPVTIDIHLSDYRTVDGLDHPFRTEMKMTGVSAGVSDADMEQARKSLDEMKSKMAEMPEDQRKMMQQMMGGQLEQLEKMVQGNELAMEMIVKDLKVNVGES
jgi:hypothetical protein